METTEHNGRAAARERWSEHIVNWRASGLTQVEYCRRAELDPNGFSNWKRKLREEKEEAGEEPGFVEVRAAAPSVLELRVGADGALEMRLNLVFAWNWSPGR